MAVATESASTVTAAADDVAAHVLTDQRVCEVCLVEKRLPTELKLLRSTDWFRRDLKTVLFHSVYGQQDTD